MSRPCSSSSSCCCCCRPSTSSPTTPITTGAAAMTASSTRRPPSNTDRRVRNCCRQFVAFLFSHIGLAAMVVSYSILGGFLFQALESPNETVVVYRLAGERKDQTARIIGLVVEQQQAAAAAAAAAGHHKQRGGGKQLNASTSGTGWNMTLLTDEVDQVLIAYQRRVAQAIKDDGWDGRDENDKTTVQWSFAGSLLFAVTVTTTIGYGHIAPRTAWGRFLTMVYALVGIPLTFLYLSTIGNFLAQCFRVFYRHICCDVCCCRRCERSRRLRHAERQMLKNSAVEAVKAAASTTEISTTSATSARCPTPLAWRKHDTSGALIGRPMKRAGSLPDCVESSTAVGRDRGFRGRSPGRGLVGSSSGDRSLPTGSTVPAAVSRVVRHNSMKVRGVAAGGRVERIGRPNSLTPQATTTMMNCGTQDDNGTSASAAALSGSPSKSIAWWKPRRRAAAASGNAKAKSAAGVRSRSVEDARGQVKAAPAKTTGKQRQDGGGNKRRRQQRRTLPEATSSPSIPRRNSELFPTTVRDETSTASADNEDRILESARRGTLRRTASERRSDRTLPINADDDDRTSVKRRPIVDDVVTQPEVVIFNVPSSASASRRPVADDWALIAEVTASDNASIASGSSTESFVTANDDISVFIDSDTDVDDETTIATAQRQQRVAHSNNLNDPPIHRAAFATSQPAMSRHSTTGAVDDFRSTSKPTGSPHRASSTDVSGTRTNNIRIRFASPARRRHDDDDEYACLVEQRTVSGGGGSETVSGGQRHRGGGGKVRVPIYICLIVIVGYILAGSVLFVLWEDWELLEASYFCFITLSTIGFGDLVPGTATDLASHEKLVLCVLWLAFGLSLLAMCFNLMQEEVKEKCKTFAKKCGLIGRDENV